LNPPSDRRFFWQGQPRWVQQGLPLAALLLSLGPAWGTAMTTLPEALPWLPGMLIGAHLILLLLALTQWASTRLPVYLCLAAYIALSAWVDGVPGLRDSTAAGMPGPLLLQGLGALQVLSGVQLGLALLPWQELPQAGRRVLKLLMLASGITAALICLPAATDAGRQALTWLRPLVSAALLGLALHQAWTRPRQALSWVAAWALLRLGVEWVRLLAPGWPAGLDGPVPYLPAVALLLEALLIQAFFGRRIPLQRRMEQDMLSAHLEARVERLRREELGQFLIMFGHEVRTPLAVIDSATQTLEMLPGADAPVLRQRHQRIRSAVKRLDSLANEALSRERCEAGRADVRLRRVDWPLLLGELLSMYTPAMLPDRLVDGMTFPMTIGGDPNGCLRLELPAQWPELMADLELTHFALGNLLDNARKYGHARTTVVLRVETTPGIEHEADLTLVRCSVTSVGPELTRSELAQVFQKYWRRNNHGHVGGAGLGLHLVQTIATLHRGRVEAQSLSGSRTRFTLVLQGSHAGRDIAAPSSAGPLPAEPKWQAA
jgi:signal transduction histidine kinase